MDLKNYIIDFLSDEWIRNTAYVILTILVCLFIGKFLKSNHKLKFAKLIALSDNLPLQLCGISNLIACCILFIPKNKTLFEFLYYAGIIGAIQAFLTPQINNFDGTNFEYLEYHISHGGILLLPIYMYNVLGYNIRKFSWLKVLIYLNLLVVIILPLNFQIDSNYMYLAYPPNVDNPLIIGEWPYYILYWEIIILIFTYTLYVLSTRKKL